MVVLMCTSRSLRNIHNAFNRLNKQVGAYLELVRIIARNIDNHHVKIDDPDLPQLDYEHAEKPFAELKRILDGLDRRGNVLGLVIFDIFLLSDFFLLRRFLRWQRMDMDAIAAWVEAIAVYDGLISMATFRYNEPSATDAEMVGSDDVVFEAQGLWHPFLGERAVRNDFTVEDSHYYIITGANMAGKSTFLRSVGINILLAYNGLPVFAEHLRVSVFSLFTSMRTTDDLSRGISYFNAELLRLKQLLGSCRHQRRTLIILDEILKGTNSLDKLNGSRLFLQEIARWPVSGIVATHDLELSKMEDEQPERFHNYCFEISLSDKITYTYKMSRGVARNQNATYLLRGILEDPS